MTTCSSCGKMIQDSPPQCPFCGNLIAGSIQTTGHPPSPPAPPTFGQPQLAVPVSAPPPTGANVDPNDRLFCEIAVDLNIITQQAAGDALHAQEIDAAIGQKKPVGAYLFEGGTITREQISQIVKMQNRVGQATQQHAQVAPPQPYATPPHPPQAATPTLQGPGAVPTPNSAPSSTSRVAYVLLGLFLGCLGIHNLVAGYAGRGVAQLLITLLLGWVYGLGVLVTALWALIEILTVTEDATGRRFS